MATCKNLCVCKHCGTTYWAYEQNKMKEDLVKYEQDARDAAGECRVEIPEPGTDAAKLLKANIMFRRKMAELETENLKLLAEIDEWKYASGLEKGGDPEGVTPKDLEDSIDEYKKEIEEWKLSSGLFGSEDIEKITPKIAEEYWQNIARIADQRDAAVNDLLTIRNEHEHLKKKQFVNFLFICDIVESELNNESHHYDAEKARELMANAAGIAMLKRRLQGVADENKQAQEKDQEISQPQQGTQTEEGEGEALQGELQWRVNRRF